MVETYKIPQATRHEIAAYELGTSVIEKYYAGAEVYDKYEIIKFALESFEEISRSVMEGELLPIVEDRVLTQEDYDKKDISHAYVINLFFNSLEDWVNKLPKEFEEDGAEIYRIIRSIILIKTAHGRAFTNKAPGEA